MKSRRLWLVLAVLLTVVTASAVVLPSTLAYITGRANTVHNTFRVEYLPPQSITVPVRVYKTVYSMGSEDMSPGGFSFRMVNLDTGDVTAMTSFTDGLATAELTFTADDVGKTYTYRLYELDGGREDMIYDDTLYDVTISLELDEQHEMVAVITMDGEPVQEIVAHFANYYNANDIPITGDQNQPTLWLAVLLLSCAALTLLCGKNAVGRRTSWIRSKSVS